MKHTIIASGSVCFPSTPLVSPPLSSRKQAGVSHSSEKKKLHPDALSCPTSISPALQNQIWNAFNWSFSLVLLREIPRIICVTQIISFLIIYFFLALVYSPSVLQPLAPSKTSSSLRKALREISIRCVINATCVNSFFNVVTKLMGEKVTIIL